jgi:serine/threonine protein kinase
MRFTERRAIEILKQVGEGLLYLHNEQVTHRDLKPDNILVRSLNPFALTLSDFGIAKMDESIMETGAGTSMYMAPELTSACVGDGGTYTNAVDIWALGVIGVELLRPGLPCADRSNRLELPTKDWENHNCSAAQRKLRKG